MKRKRNSSSLGFTIVELLIVIVVIAILATISVVAYNGIRQRAVTTAYTSAIDQWDKFFQTEVALNGPLPTVMDTCLGRATTDFPAGDDFSAGACVRNSSTSTQYTLNSAYFSALQADGKQLMNGLMPKTTWTYSVTGQTFTARGIIFRATTSAYTFYWFPQVSGQCGKGQSIFGGTAGLLTGDYCILSRPY